MNEVLEPKLPDESLVPEMTDNHIVHQFVGVDQIRANQRHRIFLQNVLRSDDEVWCYWTSSGWVPELRGTSQTVEERRDFISDQIDEVLDEGNTQGRFFRHDDNQTVLELLGDNGSGRFPPKRNRGHAAVPMLHDSEHPTHGVYPHEAQTDGHLRVMALLDDHSAGRLLDDANVVVPHKPHPYWTPERIHIEEMPFISIPTDTMVLAMPQANDNGPPQWQAQVWPHGKFSMYGWSSQLHYPNGFITGMVGYEKKEEAEDGVEIGDAIVNILEDGTIQVLDLEGHLDRAVDNAKRLGFAGLDKEFLRKILHHQLHADRRWIPQQGNKAGNRYYIRFTVVPNATGPQLVGPEQLLILMGTPIGPYKVKLEEQLRVALLGPRPVNPLVATLKNVTNYQGPVGQLLDFMQKTGRSPKDLHEAMFVKEDGTPQEGTSSNVFFIRTQEAKSGEKKIALFSPNPQKASVLPGRTVQLVMEIGRSLGWEVVGYEHDQLDMDQLIDDAQKGMVQVGMTGTAMGVRQVQELVKHVNGVTESVSLNDGSYSPEMKMLQDIYEKILSGDHELSARYMQAA